MKSVLFAIVALLLPSAAMAFGHNGAPVFTMPIIGELVHLIGWSWTTLQVVTLAVFSGAPLLALYELQLLAGICAEHSMVGKYLFGSAGMMLLTTVIFWSLFTWLIAKLVSHYIVRLQQQRFA